MAIRCSSDFSIVFGFSSQSHPLSSVPTLGARIQFGVGSHSVPSLSSNITMPALALAISTAVAGQGMGGRQRLASGGPAGRSPLIRALRAKGADLRRVASGWHDRFERDRAAAVAELVSVILVVADVPSHADVAREDVEDREPADVVQQLVASLALEASEKGADFTQHWLVGRERGSQRVRENYPVLWREIASTASAESLLGGLWQLLRDWTVALSECQFRSIRHCATVAVLHLVEGLGAQCASLREFCSAASVQLQDTEGGAPRLEALSKEHAKATKTVQLLAAARDAVGVALLSRRTKDVDSEIRRCCFEAFRCWVATDTEAFLSQQWTRYLHFSLNDREPKVRAAGLAVLEELFKEPSLTPASVRELVEHICSRVLWRCHDVDSGVGAAATRCAGQIAMRGMLGDEEFDPIIALVWHPDADRSLEAANFISKHVLGEDVIDYPGSGLSGGGLLPVNKNAGAARGRITMLLEFLGDYTQGHYALADRLAASLWKRASCLEDWETIASLALPGGEYAVSGKYHTALIHLAEATVRLASKDVAGGKGDAAKHAEAVLDRAARAVGSRLPAMFGACQAEPVAMRRVASLFRHILGHCSARRIQGASFCDGLLAGAHGEAAAEALKAAFMRQPDPDTLEFVAEAFAFLMDLSDRARPVTLDIASFLHEKMMELVPRMTTEDAKADSVPVSEALLAVATRLRILAKAVDVSLGRVRSFVVALLGLLDDRADAVSRKEATPVDPLLAVTLMELLTLVLMRHAAAMIQPNPLPHCVVHDPIDKEELKLTPTAAKDFCNLMTALLQSDPVPHVRTAALAASVALLTAWANAVRFTEAVRKEGQDTPESTPWLQLDDQLAVALCKHMGDLLTEANSVPPDSASCGQIPEPGNPHETSAFTLTFDLIHSGLHAVLGEGAGCAVFTLTDTERVRIAALACTLVTACQHPDVADSNLPAVILTQALSSRPDLQGVAWVLLGRLRREATAQPDSASAFFKVMMHAVHMVHRDAGVEVASDLSVRLLQHTGVGKLALGMQVALVAALQAGVQAAVSSESSPGFLEALVPWVTKHVVDDALLKELAAWIEAEAAGLLPSELQGKAAATHLEAAGVPAFVEACRATAERGAKAGEATAPAKALAAAAAEDGEELEELFEEASCAPAAKANVAATPTASGISAGSTVPKRAASASTPRINARSPLKRRRAKVASPAPSSIRQPVGPPTAFGPKFSQ